MSKVVKGDHNDLGWREYSDELKALIYRIMHLV
jgi:hypothetical protein